ncbi:SubName: Full=Uncharacterized protein {ECO:0000313/EMBL:CCA73739.1} [Serendipita indica DSM 11827]|uniref:Uncharacterized protein n=1 Tax=Serendipita indica (strain DSM 11827) TaxID=1109443 RepID=G4TQZ6_SERID|nr:SubName: Full=Uncharacterized protein {ECO:0000313/EMBL:CCA73739.1} [Serendipita indica DSM 11827]CCA73739.1 hypothetical protein PIIN_07694 [Serendipita indica DSM 11827]
MPRLCLFVLVLLLTAFPATAKLSVKNKPQIRVTTSFANFDARIMNHWGGGGGATWTISNDSVHPFVGREFGGAKRKQIAGTRSFGSGYPWDKDDPTTLSGRGFPFGTWPIWWGNDFMGTDEYNSTKDTIRPGGQLVTAPVQLIKAGSPFTNATEDEMYYVLGDTQSVTFMMISFVTWCNVKPAWPTKFDPLSPNTPIRLENVFQYYRASSFALASTLYNNTFARTSIANSTESSPLPGQVEYSDYRRCVDSVISNALPVMNKPPVVVKKSVTYGIIFGIFGIPMLIAAVLVVVWVSMAIGAIFSGTKLRIKQSATRKAREQEERQAALAYESFP